MRYQVKNLDTGAEVEFTLETAFRPLTVLPVPYISQLGAGADSRQNDSGATAAVMLLRAYQPESTLTPDAFYTRSNITGDPQLSLAQVQKALSSLGMPCESRAGINVQDLFAWLAGGKPVLAVLRYKVLEEAGLTEKSASGPQWVVIVGMDTKNIYVHDPFYTDPARGEAHAYPLDTFWKAWKESASDLQFPIPERSALISSSWLGFGITRKVRINITSLNIRKEPSLSSTLVGALKKDQEVEIIREMSGWGEIAGTGWISLAYTVAI